MSKYFTKTSFFEDLYSSSECFNGHVELTFDKPVARMSKQSREFFNERDREKNIISLEVLFSKWSYGPVECSYESPDRVFSTKSRNFFAQCPKNVDGG